MRTGTHPGRSFDFLSRLHDGELTPAERAHFEAHRAHCAECRHAAAEFEGALSLYRSSSTSPAAPDLSSRILRRLQARPPRRPFGVFYGIDVKWAGAFAAALIATIIGSAVVIRQAPRATTAPTTPIPVQLETRDAKKQIIEGKDTQSADAARDEIGARRAPGSSREEIVASSPPVQLRSDAAKPDARANAEQASGAAAPPGPIKEKDSPAVIAASRARQEKLLRRTAPEDELSGGERSVRSAGTLDGVEEAAFDLRITPLDGKGTPPSAISQPANLSESLRGREFVLNVSASGQVISVFPHQKAEHQKTVAVAEPEPESLKALRFEAGGGPRRLLLAIR